MLGAMGGGKFQPRNDQPENMSALLQDEYEELEGSVINLVRDYLRRGYTKDELAEALELIVRSVR